MRFLVISFYYQPDLSAGSFRTTATIRKLKALLPPGSDIDVVTTLPNRYKSFSAAAPELENEPGLNIRRFRLPAHCSGMLDQSRAYLTFSRQVMRYVKQRDYDLVFATSSRLMTAVLAAWVAKNKGAILYLDIRDLFVDTINDVLPKHFAKPTKLIFAKLERWSVQKAARINLVSEGFRDYFMSRYPESALSCFTNGIDDEFIAAAPGYSAQPSTGGPMTVLYAGNIGEGQGLHVILPRLAQLMEGALEFKVIGDGGCKEALIKALKDNGISNVELFPPTERSALIQAYQSADVLFLHLNNYDAFNKVLPSKIFEYAAMGKPIWAGLAGYSAEFVNSEIENSAIFPPCDAEEAMRVLERLEFKTAPRTDFIDKYARKNIAKAMASEILKLAKQGR